MIFTMNLIFLKLSREPNFQSKQDNLNIFLGIWQSVYFDYLPVTYTFKWTKPIVVAKTQ